MSFPAQLLTFHVTDGVGKRLAKDKILINGTYSLNLTFLFPFTVVRNGFSLTAKITLSVLPRQGHSTLGGKFSGSAGGSSKAFVKLVAELFVLYGGKVLWCQATQPLWLDLSGTFLALSKRKIFSKTEPLNIGANALKLSAELFLGSFDGGSIWNTKKVLCSSDSLYFCSN